MTFNRHGVSSSRHPGEGRDPVFFAGWAPAFAGVTNR
jgi:hypothetical protein